MSPCTTCYLSWPYKWKVNKLVKRSNFLISEISILSRLTVIANILQYIYIYRNGYIEFILNRSFSNELSLPDYVLIILLPYCVIIFNYAQCHRNHGFCSNSSGLDIPSSPNSVTTPGSPSTPGSFTSDLYSYSSAASNSTNTPSSPTSRPSFQYPGSSSSPSDSYFGRPIRGCSTPYR